MRNEVKNRSFLKKLNEQNIKIQYVRILLLTDKEDVITSIEGRVTGGSISIQGSSPIRRSGNITFVAENAKNDLTDIDNLISINKKIKISIGIENNINKVPVNENNKDDLEVQDIIWFPQGIFVITDPSISHNMDGVSINIAFKDKMCLLNGDMGGNLPASVTFNEYDQLIGYDDKNGSISGYDKYPDDPNTYTVYKIKGEYMMYSPQTGWYSSSYSRVGEKSTVQQRIFDIIQTLVANYGGEDLGKIIIEDVPLELKSVVRYVGNNTLYFNKDTSVYTMNSEVAKEDPGNWITYKYNEDCGYIYTDFTYPGELISSLGSSVASVLDTIANELGNFEYFYDIEGNFVFRQKKNYLNTQYDPIQSVDKSINLSLGKRILDFDNYYVNFSVDTSSIYTFEEGSILINSYSCTPSYTNIKNDFHIWGKAQDGYANHYHVAFKQKPIYGEDSFPVVYEVDDSGVFTGRVSYATAILPNQMTTKEIADWTPQTFYLAETYIRESGRYFKCLVNHTSSDSFEVDFQNNRWTPVNGKVPNDYYIPEDWRAHLYLVGLQKASEQVRPDIYEQELLDLFDGIYNMKEKKFKVDLVNRPNDLKYWFDYIDTTDEMMDLSVDSIGTRILAEQRSSIKKLYDADIPNVIMIDLTSDPISRASTIAKCENSGQAYSNVDGKIYRSIAIGTWGYTSQEIARDLIYQHTDYNEGINFSSMPIYNLDVNNRITIIDQASGISGDYVISSINIPLDTTNLMTVTATKALQRV